MDVLSILRRVGEMGTVAIDNSPNVAHNALHAHTRRVFMRKVKSVKKFVIYELNERERAEYGFNYAPVLKESVEAYGKVYPYDADIECETLDQAISWAKHY